MARDYKHSTAGRERRKKAVTVHGSWLSFLSGLGIGLLVAFGVYLWGGHLRPPASTPLAATNSIERDYVEPAELPAPSVELPRPKFDFYKILPEMEVPIPDWELDEAKAGENGGTESEAAAPAIGDGGTYLLQVGSFKRFEDADRVKATLALRGISATIQRVVINGQDVWFRVHVGPLADADAIRAMRVKLIENDMDFILLRIGDTRAASKTRP